MKTTKITNTLEKKDSGFKYSGEMEKEFTAMKKMMREIRKLALPDCKTPHMLRTSASNTKLDVVLLHENVNEECVPFQ